ncbi:MAG: glycosyltransferase [Myxococcota bacterium]|nr:glycosyltransferase [Myxococcota bacterium]
MAAPRVSVGIPVYNGAAYLDEAIRSVQAQTLDEIEILISDNGSTDASREIAARRAAGDARIRLVRQAENRGAAWNYNELLRLARAPLFKWTPADDRMAPLHLERCVAALEAAPSAVLAYPRTELIDAEGRVTGVYDDRLALTESEPWRRAAHFVLAINLCNAVLGVFRRDVLRRTRQIQGFAGADAVLLLEAALRGQILEIPDRLFQRRIHAAASHEANCSRAALERWFDPNAARRFRLPVRYELLGAYLRAAYEAPLPAGQRFLAATAIAGCWSYRRTRVTLGRWRRRLRGDAGTGGDGRWSGMA